MTVRVLPDTEQIIVHWLLGVPEVAATVGDRVGTTLDVTSDTGLPAVRVTRVSSTLIAARQFRSTTVQLEAWATDELTARDLCELCWAALFEDDFVGVHGAGVVTGVADSLGPRSFPDTLTDTPRWLASVTVYAHPNP